MPSSDYAGRNLYAELQDYFQSMLRRAETGRVLLRADDLVWERNRHALLGYYMHPFITDTALHSMQLFLNVIKQHGGMHRHQGGVVIFVLEGQGYTIADEQQVDWEAGDLILLPMRPGGVAHQHINTDPDKPSRWLAFISNAFREHSGYEIVQLISRKTTKLEDKRAEISELLNRKPPTPAERSAFIKGLREKAKVEIANE